MTTFATGAVANVVLSLQQGGAVERNNVDLVPVWIWSLRGPGHLPSNAASVSEPVKCFKVTNKL